jgi:hypothetical protein
MKLVPCSRHEMRQNFPTEKSPQKTAGEMRQAHSSGGVLKSNRNRVSATDADATRAVTDAVQQAKAFIRRLEWAENFIPLVVTQVRRVVRLFAFVGALDAVLVELRVACKIPRLAAAAIDAGAAAVCDAA